MAQCDSLLLILDEIGDVVDEEAAQLGGGELSYIRASINAAPSETRGIPLEETTVSEA